MNVALYARVSSEQQAEKDLSIPAQLKALRRYAHERHWEVVNEYIDEAHTGRTDKRPAFQAMIFAARHKECQAILVWKYDRFARNLKIQLLYMEELSSYGIEVISINEPHEDTPLGRFGRANMGAVAQLFSEILAQDVRRGQKENASRGFYNGGPPPFGFAIERISTHGVSRRKLMPDPATAPIVRQIYDLYLSGLGLRKIAHHLN